MNLDYTTIGNWCVDAHQLIAPHFSENHAQMRLDAITKHIGKPAIIQIAQELAEHLNDLPVPEKLAAQDALRSKHGFGFDYFILHAQSRLTNILARGHIRNEAEHRAVLDALSDTGLDPSLALHLDKLLTSHESNTGAT